MMGKGREKVKGSGVHRECASVDLFGFSVSLELTLLKSFFSPQEGDAKDSRYCKQNRKDSPEMKWSDRQMNEA